MICADRLELLAVRCRGCGRGRRTSPSRCRCCDSRRRRPSRRGSSARAGQPLADARVVEHLGHGPGVRAARARRRRRRSRRPTCAGCSGCSSRGRAGAPAGRSRRSGRCRGAACSAMSVISSSVKPTWPSSGPGVGVGPLELQPGERRASGRSGRAAGGSAPSAAGRGSGRPAGSRPARRRRRSAARPAANDRLPMWNWCEAVPSARRVRARRRCVSLELVDDLARRPSAAAGSRPGRAGRSGRRPRPR